MKFSLAWTFDHIQIADWRSVDVARLVELFNKKTAEIERWERVKLNADSLFLVCVQGINEKNVVVEIDGHQELVNLPLRKDAEIGRWFAVSSQKAGFIWTTLASLGSEKEGLLAAIDVRGNEPRASLKKVDWDDVIIEVDNKSITHRPDLWGHRGFAQEIAVLLDLPIKPLELFLEKQPLDVHSDSFNTVQHSDLVFSLSIQTPLCKRFAALYVPAITFTDSQLWMAVRLARVGSKPINFLVDATNYVMQDIGHPMHVFDAEKLQRELVVRMAQNGQTLITLDSDTITLCADDIIIADATGPVSLAGVMGGSATSVTRATQSVLLEAAHFEPTPIRLSAARHKKRTESSARFEKDLDANNPIIAIERFVHLLSDALVVCTITGPLVVLGKPAQSRVILLKHQLLQQSLGVALESELVCNIFKKLHFSVEYDDVLMQYTVTVPSVRSNKDITCAEDLVEEIGRIYGYDRIVPELPAMYHIPATASWSRRLRFIKQFLSSSAAMNELQNLAFFDEVFIASLGWQPKNFVEVQNPVSSNWKKLVTSLVPGLLKAVQDNVVDHTALRFFESGRIWREDEGTIVERRVLSGVMYQQMGDQTIFYCVQTVVTELISLIGARVTYRAAKSVDAWQAPYQTAEVLVGDRVIGTISVIRPSFLKAIVKTGAAAIFDLDLDWLLHAPMLQERYASISKFPEVSRDLSLLVPRDIAVQTIKESIRSVDTRIEQVLLTDRFESDQWPEMRALTLRMVIVDHHKTLMHQEIDALLDKVIATLQVYRVVLR